MFETDFGAVFADPVHGAQASFRAILDALSHPGTRHGLVSAEDAPPALGPELSAIALTLCDHDIPIWLSPRLDVAPVRAFFGFHTAAPIVSDTVAARLAFVAGNDPLPALSAFAPGTDEYPDRSATIVIAVTALSGGSPLVLSGPGIRDTQAISPIELPPDFTAQWANNRALFPRGVDLLLVADGAVLGLPRTSRLVEEH